MTLSTTLSAALDDQASLLLAMLLLWASLLLSCAWLIAASLRRASSSVRYCVWQFAVMGLLARPVLFALLPGIPLGYSLRHAEQKTPVTSAFEAATQVRAHGAAAKFDSQAISNPGIVAQSAAPATHAAQSQSARNAALVNDAPSTAHSSAQPP